ncbi:MAG: hypothetical protein DLM56_03685 [Pseudonocardiales bacterium]|nr:MAG: hypothetical protein DLM56_03685 [Pseudonocardiales bacterium]
MTRVLRGRRKVSWRPDGPLGDLGHGGGHGDGPGRDDGGAGVREPRRPKPTLPMSGAAPLPRDDEQPADFR